MPHVEEIARASNIKLTQGTLHQHIKYDPDSSGYEILVWANKTYTYKIQTFQQCATYSQDVLQLCYSYHTPDVLLLPPHHFLFFFVQTSIWLIFQYCKLRNTPWLTVTDLQSGSKQKQIWNIYNIITTGISDTMHFIQESSCSGRTLSRSWWHL